MSFKVRASKEKATSKMAAARRRLRSAARPKAQKVTEAQKVTGAALQAKLAVQKANSNLRSAEAPTAPEVPKVDTLGVLRVQVISATDIPDAYGNGSESTAMATPYAKIFLGATPEAVRTTHVLKRTLNPEWGAQFDFHGTLADMVTAPLEVEVSHQDKGGLSNKELGRATLPFGKEVVFGKAMEGALNTQGTIKLFASFAPFFPVLSNKMHIKKKGISGGRYALHDFTLSRAEGIDGWSSHRLAYRDSHDVEHAATVLGMSGVAPMRYELTILTHENQGYAIRCGSSDEFTQLTDAIKQIVPPPLSHDHTEALKSHKKKSGRWSPLTGRK